MRRSPLYFIIASLLLLTATFAQAQETTFGASLGYGAHDATPLHAQLDVTLAMQANDLMAGLPENGHVGIRFDATVPFTALTNPGLGTSIVWRQPLQRVTAYAGMGADLRWFEVNDVRCYETAARAVLGIEVPVSNGWSLRAEGTALSTGRFAASVGVAFSLP